jgi:hypothetical protein
MRSRPVLRVRALLLSCGMLTMLLGGVATASSQRVGGGLDGGLGAFFRPGHFSVAEKRPKCARWKRGGYRAGLAHSTSHRRPCRRKGTKPSKSANGGGKYQPQPFPDHSASSQAAVPGTVETSANSPSSTSPESSPVHESEDDARLHRFYSSSSFWNAPVPSSAPLDPASAAIVGSFDSLIAAELQDKSGPAINTTEWSVPLYTVPADQPLVRVHLDAPNAPALQEALNAVPVPSAARPAAGTDARLVVWQPGTDKLWELWRAVRKADGWHASWGGATQNVSSASGVPDAQSWPGAKPWWGSSGCSMGVVGGLITLEDLRQGVINHALQIAIPNVRGGAYASPALRTDGESTDPLSLPEGAHLRLDPSLDLESLHLPRLTLMMARAAQRYGIFVINGAKNVAFQAQDPIPTGTEPYRGPGGYFEGSYPRALLSSFPWAHLQLLRMELHESSREVIGERR